MNVCARCGKTMGLGMFCDDCEEKFRQEKAKASRDVRARKAAPEMLKQLQQWVDAVDKCNCASLSRMFPDDPEITCNTCDTRALIAKIEEV